jgi:hypothetical protein
MAEQTIFQSGQEFGASDVVTNIKLEDIVNAIVVDYPALAQAIMNSGATDPNALVRFTGNQLQLRNAESGLWHSIWIKGSAGEEEIVLGQGTT